MCPMATETTYTRLRENWVRSDRSTAIRVLDLVDAVMRDPFHGTGKARAAQVSPRRLLVKAPHAGMPCQQ